MEPMFLSCCICFRKSSSVKRVGRELLGDLLRLFFVEVLLRLLDQGQDVAEVQDAAAPCGPGWNGSKSSRPSPVDANMIGRPVMDATESAAPPRASPSSFVSTTPVKSTPSWNARAVVTASWPIIASMTNSTSSGSTALRMSDACFISSASMPRRPAVSTMTVSNCLRSASLTPSFATLTGSPTPLPGSGAKTGDAGLLADDLQLGDGVRALEVGRDQQRGVALLREPLRELAGEGRLTGTLEAGEHDDGRRLLRELEPALLPAEDRDELLVDDLHDLLGRVQRLVDLVAEGALAHLAGEVLDDLERDVGVEQGATDLADGAVDIRGGELALGAEVAERRGEAIRERAECCHGALSLINADAA